MPLPVDTTSLVNEMRATLTEINAQIEAAREDHAAMRETYTIYQMRYSNGQYVLTDLLVAKANLLAGIASLQTKGPKSGRTW